MPERAPVSIVWRQQDPTVIEVAFEDGETESVSGTHADAARLAREARLQPVAAPLGTTKWVKGPRRAGGRAPKRIGPWLSE